jgi:hypothetical protein
MSSFFLDTSGLVTRYLAETGTVWIRVLSDPAAEHTLAISEVTLVEAGAALAARQRGGFITLEERNTAVDLLLRHADTEYALAPLTRTIVDGIVTHAEPPSPWLRCSTAGDGPADSRAIPCCGAAHAYVCLRRW